MIDVSSPIPPGLLELQLRLQQGSPNVQHLLEKRLCTPGTMLRYFEGVHGALRQVGARASKTQP